MHVCARPRATCAGIYPFGRPRPHVPLLRALPSRRRRCSPSPAAPRLSLPRRAKCPSATAGLPPARPPPLAPLIASLGFQATIIYLRQLSPISCHCQQYYNILFISKSFRVLPASSLLLYVFYFSRVSFCRFSPVRSPSCCFFPSLSFPPSLFLSSVPPTDAQT